MIPLLAADKATVVLFAVRSSAAITTAALAVMFTNSAPATERLLISVAALATKLNVWLALAADTSSRALAATVIASTFVVAATVMLTVSKK